MQGIEAGLAVHERSPDADTLLLELEGELDLDGVKVASDRIDAAPLSRLRRILLDLRHLRFCDSSGLNFLLRLHRQASHEGVDMALVAPSDTVMRLLCLTGTDTVFTIQAPHGRAPDRAPSRTAGPTR